MVYKRAQKMRDEIKRLLDYFDSTCDSFIFLTHLFNISVVSSQYKVKRIHI